MGTAVATDVPSIVAWCRGYLANLLDVEEAEVDPDADFDRLGVDSALAVSLLVEVEERYAVDIAPEALFENPTITAVATYLHERLR
ncbi:acyl carrier protein [Pseudonocardia kujensis]|uniref:acyl carrier protein n=1 Tax=Pseudonocardia kujensis TaxID=1128675 RepID=UPI001E312113|nr:acyl carrier protein [Pseudonocardia kujensis]MCE0764878.1 acyl carrier protein [Pseudonocardia kujensis]